MCDRLLFRWLTVFALIVAPSVVRAGAWTQDTGHWLSISSSDYSQALDGYDGKGRAIAPIRFTKVSARDLIEYGWNDKLTLFIDPEYITAQSVWDRKIAVTAKALSIEAGARYRVFDKIGVLSVQSSYRSSGAFDLSNSRDLGSASIVELRVLYGTNFTLLGLNAFGDAELGERYVTHPRPNETVLDLTAGVWLGDSTMAMLQSFNVVSGGDWEPPDTYFRSHKIELSLVQQISEKWSLQVGAYVSPAGQNALVEQGVSMSIWMRDQ
jgi:protein XagA